MFSSERLKGIGLFVCVADMGSFTLAAERLNLTASAVSKGIARLESRLQTKLFQRTTRRLALTDAGTQFYRTCTGVLAELEEAELAMQAESAEPRGRVRIDLPASFGRLHALPVILRCIEDHPLLVPHITFSDRFADPVSEGIDILVRIGGSDVWPNTLGHHYLGKQRHIFCAAPGYLKRQGEPTTAAELAHHHCVLYQENDGVQLQVDGILFLATVLTKEWAAIAQDLHQIPLVQVCRNTESEHIDVVNIDGYRAGEEIAALLIEQGHRRFGYMKGPDTQSSHLLGTPTDD